ncbi:hypothetical protein LUZ60_008117 [Juncus effusus]|nr:hypothetical protein LUZ60_008117 [Juncus effusus]
MEVEEETKREREEATPLPAFKPKSIVSQGQIDKFKELSQKLLQVKGKNEQKSKSKATSIASKRKCIDLDSATNEEASNPNTCTDTKLDEMPSSRPKYKKKLHWGLDTKEKWERKSNM